MILILCCDEGRPEGRVGGVRVFLTTRRVTGQLFSVVALELLDAVFEILCVIDACLEDGKLVHLLPFTSRYHVFQCVELLVHL